MNKMDEKDAEKKMQGSSDMENGTYEVIKSRLDKQGADLNDRIVALNEKRKEVFGSVETKLLGSERIITEHNCIARDMAPVDDLFLFGYNVHIGLKSKVSISDVFSIYKYSEGTFTKRDLELIHNSEFENDFDELYQYYKNTIFAKFTVKEPYFYMIFQTGKNATDIKVFKWLMEGKKLTYVDSRSEHEVRFELSSELNYVKATRDDQRSGIHPHISILDKVFVETVDGDLTIKVEDNTNTGKGIYSEPVDDPDQTLDDAEIYYADLEDILILKIRPYREEAFRYFIYNNKIKNVVRADSIQDTCVLLPGHHGIIFPKGYYLKDGEYKNFDVEAEHAIFDEQVSSSNGEDYQYIFYNIDTGVYFIYSYNMIAQKIDTPIVCSGYSHFSSGEMILFKQENEPSKNHMIQIWKTPFVGKNHVVEGNKDSLLYKIGNKDIVRAMADLSGVYRLILKGDGYQSIYVDIVKECERIADSYYWLDNEESGNLREILMQIKETSAFAISEFEKVTRLKASAAKQIAQVKAEAEELLSNLTYGSFENIDDYVKALSSIRMIRGKIVSLRDLRYTDLSVVDALDTSVKEKNEEFSGQCVSFLLAPEGLKPYEEKAAKLQEEIPNVNKSKEGKELEARMNETSNELELLIGIVGNFKIEDPTMTTEIIEKISALFSIMNNAKARLANRIEEMNKQEMTTQFYAQIKLLSQSVINYMDLSDTVEKCEDSVNKVMVMIQELESRFAEFPDYVMQIGEKREEIYNAFEGRKQSILEKTNQKITGLFASAERILNGIANRLKGFSKPEEINGYLATDLMVEKVRDVVSNLKKLGDSVKADEIQSRLKTISEGAIRQLKDRNELYADGENIVKFGKHHFSVNMKPVDLSIVQKDGGLYYHITGTDFWEQIEEEGIEKYRHVFNQSVVSENDQVYRGEYLAYQIFKAAKSGEKNVPAVEELRNRSEAELALIVQSFMESRYQEGYTKGVHDSDAAKILKALLDVHARIDLLIYKNECRAFARMYWTYFAKSSEKEKLCRRLKELAKVSVYFSAAPKLDAYLPPLMEQMKEANKVLQMISEEEIKEAATYLCLELMKEGGFVVSKEAKTVYDGFRGFMRDNKQLDSFVASIEDSRKDIEGLYYFVRECVNAYKTAVMADATKVLEGAGAVYAALSESEIEGVQKEVIVLLLEKEPNIGRVIYVDAKQAIGGLIGNHKQIEGGTYTFVYAVFMEKMKHFAEEDVKDFTVFEEKKKSLIKAFKDEIHLDDYKPKVLTSFVRNKLIDKVYLPLIGDNLAKQIGVAGENKRTDLMGLLLLLSPPGYGKTTLMEYIASRLGIILVKVNGPSLGNQVVSLDPDKAVNTGAKEELKKLNIALKMGNNVMIYLDDIQHCNPEFLQKFISLCDGQRKMEGVYKGKGVTYDLRGKKVAVVMAGNPYTESGETFKIPDMLANRADVYNLGDMLRENEEAFKLSYIENSLTSNPVLSKLTNVSGNDLYGIISLAEGAKREQVELEESYSMDELNEYTSVLEKLLKVRDIVLKVNLAYIYSAAQADEYRSEPAFKLQGSYRNMNKIAEKIVPVMNEAELFEKIVASYENDAQTLTTGAESNLLKWKELVGCMTEEERMRYEEIKTIYQKNKLVKGDDKIGQAVLSLSALSSQIEMIKEILKERM
ncbi:MAG: AAA family ATPase [Lachnospiraceae bacterium]|nr:AAA family ATPase [Lachnospiraceae bacterium]